MKGAITVLAALIVVGLAWSLYRSPGAPPEMTEAERAQIEAEVRQGITNLMDTWKDACLKGDPAAFMSIYTRDARVYYPGMNFERNELQTAMEEYLQAATWTEVDGKVLEVFVDGDAAYAISELSETIQMEGQETESHISNCFSRFVKEDGAWKVDRDLCGPKDASPEG